MAHLKIQDLFVMLTMSHLIFIMISLHLLKFILEEAIQMKQILSKITLLIKVFLQIQDQTWVFILNLLQQLLKEKRQIKIISIDALPINNFRLKENLKLLKKKIPNIFSLVKIKNCAVGDRKLQN